MDNHQITHQTDSDKLRLRVLQIKAQVPRGIDYIPYYEQVFGKQEEDSRKLIRNVWNLRAVDEAIIANLEKMVEHIKAA